MTKDASTIAAAAPSAFVPPRAKSARVTTIDGLRGVAAMLVVLFHLHEAISRTATDWLWKPVEAIVARGYLGVDVFFVISGFVIALSVSRGSPTPSYFGRFVLRRSIRLDPPYWAAIGIELALLAVTLRWLPDRGVAFPSGPQIAAHFFYLQELLGYGSIITIFWTLCYEIQFYAFYVGLTVARAQLPSWLRGHGIAASAMAMVFLVSLWTRYWPPAWLPEGLAINRWFQFFLGVLTWRAVTDARRIPALVAAWVFVAASILLAGAPLPQFLAIAVSAIVLASARFPEMGRLLRTRPLLFLGSISYSLYLFHTPFGWRFVSLVQLFFPGPWSPLFALSVYAAGVAVCIAASTVLWRLIEKPLLEFSQRVTLPLRAETPDGAVTAASRAAA